MKECGIVLLLFAPIAYVDATAAWRLGSKWQRIRISAAGLYAEIFCAAIAAWVWSLTSPGVANHVAYHVVVMAGITTVLFNGNPLMRFDAYHVLADLLEVPNLGARGQEYVYYLARRYLFAIPTAPADGPPGRALVIRFYGLLACVWRLFVLVSLLFTAHTLFFGAGLIIAALGALVWFGGPFMRFVKYLTLGNGREKPNVGRFVVVSASASVLAGWVLFQVPWPGAIRATAVIQAEPQVQVRSQISGFVEQLFVGDGQAVRAGQLLARIENRQLQTELQELQLEFAQLRLRRNQLQEQQNVAASQIQSEYITALQKRLDEKQRQVSSLAVRAPISGRIARRRLDSLQGTYVEPGTELLTIAGAKRKALVSIDQKDLHRFVGQVGRRVTVDLRDGSLRRLEGRMCRIDPHASKCVPFPALSAAAGGPLAVRPMRDVAPQSDARDDVARQTDDRYERSPKPSYEFLSPRFLGTIELAATQDVPIPIGQLATISFHSHPPSIAHHLGQSLADWLRLWNASSRR